jgi:hypothetical protein
VREFPSKEGWRAAAFESVDPSRLTLPPQPEQVRINNTKIEAAPTLHIMQILDAKIMNTINSICRRHRQEADDMSKKSNNIDI